VSGDEAGQVVLPLKPGIALEKVSKLSPAATISKVMFDGEAASA
jgi:hypothetical protein